MASMTGMDEREGRVVSRIPEDTYARRLMLARDFAGRLSIREAAEKCGINYGTWAGWERGAGSRTKIEDAEVIATVLGVDRDWLLHGGELPRPNKPRRIRVTYPRRSLRPGDRHDGERRARRLQRVPA